MSKKHAPQIVEASRLADVALAYDDPEVFSQVIDENGNFRKELSGQWFACVWGDNCVTTQHLSDASIQGPFDTQEEALEYVS